MIERKMLAVHQKLGGGDVRGTRYEMMFTRGLASYVLALGRSGLEEAEVNEKVKALRRKVGLEAAPAKEAPKGPAPLL